MEKLSQRQITNRIKKELTEIERHKNQKPVKEATFTIEWHRSRTWGNCPRLTAEIHFKDGTFTRADHYYASGCGYDKASTVLASAFNDFLRYKLYQRRELKSRINQEETNYPYGVYYYDGGVIEPKEGEYYYRKPSFNGGVGISCYYKIGEFIGGTFEQVASGRTFDVYKYTDKE